MIPAHSIRSSIKQAFSLIEILLVCVVLVALGAGLSVMLLGHGKPGEKAKTPIDRAKSTVCQSNLTSIRQSIAASQAGDTDGKFPQTLEELKLPKEILSCDVGKEPYIYDPATGTVRCIHPGHENY